jgi:pimeloyl-ACP methyl ester carboxylesterase
MTLSVFLPDGGRLWLTRRGGPRAPVTVVLVHGWCLDSRSWYRVADRLAGPDVRVVCYDARGHGLSSSVLLADATIGRLADDLARVLDSAVPEGPVVLAGHSMGGMAIMELAARYPQRFGTRIRAAVLVSTTAETVGTLRTRADRAIRRVELLMHRVLRLGGRWRPHRPLARPLLRPGMSWLVFGDRPDREATRLAADMIASTPALTIGGFRPAIEAHDRLDALSTLAGIPVSVVVGAQDRLTPPAAAAAIAGVLPHARHVVLSRAGHMLPLERPAEVVAEIHRVIDEALGGGAADGGPRDAGAPGAGASRAGTAPLRTGDDDGP